ncbi:MULTISPECIES: DinB family protein [unclassified Pseudofrankia]|uniref:DinB family protein n=1 Tax=unclassified Pseudofrankia TaxID=2994372 RepID=UPI0018E29816|nr:MULTISPECIES: DinB family protein [unclassified Pseudofrankia]MDT3444042.1 DinB family protein [Pseudofrankia sp. BMG5.37]
MEPSPRPPALRVMQANTAGEREILEAFLDFYRDVVAHKVLGVGDQEARRRLVPSATTLAGLVRHLTTVERNWFHRLTGENPDLPESSWALTDADALGALLKEYDQACAQSRAAAAGFALDHVVPHPDAGEVSVRWIYVHMIEETARHAGHADILRELTDGATGVLG